MEERKQGVKRKKNTRAQLTRQCHQESSPLFPRSSIAGGKSKRDPEKKRQAERQSGLSGKWPGWRQRRLLPESRRPISAGHLRDKAPRHQRIQALPNRREARTGEGGGRLKRWCDPQVVVHTGTTAVASTHQRAAVGRRNSVIDEA